jgi:hypothetical protein
MGAPGEFGSEGGGGGGQAATEGEIKDIEDFTGIEEGGHFIVPEVAGHFQAGLVQDVGELGPGGEVGDLFGQVGKIEPGEDTISEGLVDGVEGDTEVVKGLWGVVVGVEEVLRVGEGYHAVHIDFLGEAPEEVGPGLSYDGGLAGTTAEAEIGLGDQVVGAVSTEARGVFERTEGIGGGSRGKSGGLRFLEEGTEGSLCRSLGDNRGKGLGSEK